MNEDFVPYELAIKLKEKGFEIQEECKYLYYNEELVKIKNHSNISPYKYAPTISQVLKWLREEKNISIEVGIHCSLKWMCSIYDFSDGIADFTRYSEMEKRGKDEYAPFSKRVRTSNR